MKRSFIFLFFLLGATASISIASAQEKASGEQLLKKAGERLAKGAEISFSFEILSQGQPAYKTRGEMLLMGEKFRLRYDGTILCYDGGEATSYDIQHETLTITSPTPEELLMMSPILMLKKAGNEHNIKEHPSKKGERSFLMTPRQGGKLYKSVMVHFVNNEQIPNRIEVKTTNSSELLLTLSSVKEREDLTKEYFVLKKEQYPNSEVIDLR